MIQSQTVTPPLAAIDGDNVEIEHGDNEEQHQITASEGADQVRLGGLWVSDKGVLAPAVRTASMVGV